MNPATSLTSPEGTKPREGVGGVNRRKMLERTSGFLAALRYRLTGFRRKKMYFENGGRERFIENVNAALCAGESARIECGTVEDA